MSAAQPRVRTCAHAGRDCAPASVVARFPRTRPEPWSSTSSTPASTRFGCVSSPDGTLAVVRMIEGCIVRIPLPVGPLLVTVSTRLAWRQRTMHALFSDELHTHLLNLGASERSHIGLDRGELRSVNIVKGAKRLSDGPTDPAPFLPRQHAGYVVDGMSSPRKSLVPSDMASSRPTASRPTRRRSQHCEPRWRLRLRDSPRTVTGAAPHPRWSDPDAHHPRVKLMTLRPRCRTTSFIPINRTRTADDPVRPAGEAH